MAKLSKRGVSNLLLILLVTGLISLTMFSCTIRMAQNDTYVDMDSAVLRQLETPSDDAPAMVIQTSMGDITAVLYPEAAPNYVAEFTKLAASGYYDDTYVYQVEQGVYFGAGSPEEDGSLGAETDIEVETEISADLWPFRGAFCAPITHKDNNFFRMLFNNDTSYCGSRFLVCNSIAFDETTRAEMAEISETAADITNTFLSWGGIPNYAQQMTIFAQAYGKESFDVIDAITGVSTKEENDASGYTAPETPIRIETVTITTWGETAQDSFVPEGYAE